MARIKFYNPGTEKWEYADAQVGIPGDKGDKGEKGDKGDTGADGKDYVLTDGDRADIAALVIEMLGGNPIFGIVDANNHIVLNGNLPDGTYSVKYEMENGNTVNIGNLVLDTNVYYTVTNNLTNCTNSNSATKAAYGGSYSATISAKSGYELSSVTVTMGGNNVTVTNGVINIANVTGNIVITATATEKQTGPTNLAQPNSSEWLDGYRWSLSGKSAKECEGHIVTNYIPAKMGDILRVKGLHITGSYYNEQTRMIYCNASKEQTGGTYGAKSSISNDGYADNVTINGDINTFTIFIENDGTQLARNDTAYVRIDGALMNGYTKNDVIITINEEIPA